MKNASASPMLWTSFAFLCAVVAIGVPTLTYAESSEIIRDSETRVQRGENVLVVTAARREPLSAARCEALTESTGVLAAGGVVARDSIRMLAHPSTATELVLGTPGLPMVIWPDLASSPLDTSVVSGAELAIQGGLWAGAPVSFWTSDEPDPRGATVSAVAARSLRSAPMNGALVMTVPAQGAVQECIVESRPGSRDDVASLVEGWFVASGSVSITPLLRIETGESTPADRLDRRITAWLPLLAASTILVGYVAYVLTRRADLALYRTLGLKPSGLLLMVLGEWVLLVAVPVGAGAVISMFIVGSGKAPVGVLLASLDVLRFCVLLLPIPLLALFILIPMTRLDAIRGR